MAAERVETAERADGAGRFVWPPRPAPAEGAVAVASAAVEEHRSDAEGAGRRAAGETPLSGVVRDGVWRSVERVWLGLAAPPWRVRAAEAGWEQDSAGAYCGRCGTTVGPHEGDEAGCVTCRGRRVPWDRFVRVGEYAGLLREAVVEVKFTRWRRLGDDLGRLLGDAVLKELRGAGVDLGRVVIVPVPTTFRRRVWRGIDHSLVIARGVSRASGLPVERLLEREHRPSQLEVAPSRRGANVAGSMRVRVGARVAGRVVVLVDDVRTTGATMAAATRAVRRGPIGPGEEGLSGVWAAVIGVTPEPGRRERVRRGGEGEGVLGRTPRGLPEAGWSGA